MATSSVNKWQDTQNKEKAAPIEGQIIKVGLSFIKNVKVSMIT